ncbi:4-coumarate--CoA ligase 1 [Bacillus thuringiensis IBL 4222]|nr:4-coumarate--CoA ligase 1 [Bacillus thuringiensis IBL 4222]
MTLEPVRSIALITSSCLLKLEIGYTILSQANIEKYETT